MTKNVEIAGTTYQMTVNAEGVSIHRLENGTWVGCCSESSIDNCAAVFGDEDTTEAVYDELQDLVDE